MIIFLIFPNNKKFSNCYCKENIDVDIYFICFFLNLFRKVLEADTNPL